MTDLSKIPDLELRQKVKPLYERITALNSEVSATRKDHQEKLNALVQPLRDEVDRLEEQMGGLLEDHPTASEVMALCEATGLPVFDTDDTTTKHTLACV